MESMGFIFGMAGVSFAIIAWGQIAMLRKEFETIKTQLAETNVKVMELKIKESSND